MSRKLLIVSLLILSITSNSYAYLDPGTGSSIIQLLIAGALGGAYVIKTYWQRIVGFIKGGKVKNDGIDDDEL